MKKMMVVIVAAVLVSSCTQVAGWFGNHTDSTSGKQTDSSSYAAFRDESITEANAYSDLFLDSAALESYIQKEKLSDSAAREIRNFYLVRNFQYAWFTTHGMTEQARAMWNLYAGDSSNADKKLKTHMDSLMQNDSLQLNKGDSSFAQTELDLTRQLVQYASRQDSGLITTENIYYLVPAKKQDVMQLADSILHKEKDSVQYANNKAYNALKQQLAIYYRAAQDSSIQNFSIHSAKLKKGSTTPQVTQLKKRLAATGDYVSTDTSAKFNDSLEMAIKDYQYRNGLAATGVVNDSLVQVLNIPARQRVEQILVNLNRSLWMRPMNDSNRIMVNIPSLMLYAYEDSGKVFEMPVIVGKEGTSTLMFSGDISEIVFNPVWHIPQSIVEKDIMPKMKADPKYLEKNNMEIVNNKDSVPQINQLPGKNNSLGEAKFLFPNSYDIYLHDTPDKTLFAKKDRALSHGCIRVADAEKLAQYLLRDQKDWSAQKVQETMKGDKEQHVAVKQKEPVYITYFTAWVDEKGKLNFRNDVYGHDKETGERMFTSM
jgi:L,D-transpeptidase YcbB